MRVRLCCLLVLASLLLAAASEDEFQRHMAAGEEFYNNGDHNQAVKQFKKAVKLEPNSSMAHMWLGRALGRKAEKSNPLRAAFMVGGVRREFERAVELDPRNLEARSDLLDFYLDAPGAFGGSHEKARKQAEAMAQLDRAEGHSGWARIALKEKRYAAAEREYRAAVEAAPAHGGYQRDLEKFLKKYKEYIQDSKSKNQGPDSAT